MSSGRKRVLLVTSSYAPTLIADMHRVRHLAWELPALGWDAEVLAPNTAFQRPECVEPDSGALFNPAVPGHAVAPRDFWFFRPLKIRSIGWRALRPMAHAGDALLRARRFDLVFISTAKFSLFCLGRRWARKFGVPYVLDYHDPWVRDRIDLRTTRHKFKRRVGAWLSRWMERSAINGASGIVSVSPVYLEELRRRYGNLPCLRPERCAAIPFAGSERDFPAPAAVATGPAGGSREIIYVGAGGAIMAKAFATICAGLAEVRRTNPELLASVKIRLFGTNSDWRPGGAKPLAEMAASHGLGDVVEESPAWISYRRAMELTQRADGLLVLGVDDAGYVPSKLFNCALSGKPLLASFRSDTPPVKFFAQLPGLGNLLTFTPDGARSPDECATVMRKFLGEVGRRETFDRRSLMADHLAPGMACQHAALFERVCAGREEHA